MGFIIIIGIAIALVSTIVYLYIGYAICSRLRTMGQTGKEIFAFVNKTKQYKLIEGVKIKKIQVKKKRFYFLCSLYTHRKTLQTTAEKIQKESCCSPSLRRQLIFFYLFFSILSIPIYFCKTFGILTLPSFC